VVTTKMNGVRELSDELSEPPSPGQPAVAPRRHRIDAALALL